jgi:hypothetical protein
LLKTPSGRDLEDKAGDVLERSFQSDCGKTVGTRLEILRIHRRPTGKGFPRFFHMSVNPVISTRRVLHRELKKIGFLDFLSNHQKERKKESDG